MEEQVSTTVTRRLRIRAAALADRLTAWLQTRDADSGISLLVIGACIGVVSGLGVVAFYKLIDGSFAVLTAWPEEHVPFVGRAILRVVCTSLGVWLAWLITRAARAGEGQNVPDVQLAVATKAGQVAAQAVVARTVASAVTLGSGGSVGSEGPVAVLGAMVGSVLGRGLKFQPRYVKIFVGCGAAAGIAGAFNAPFAGAFFALEEILGSFSVDAFSPVVIASVVGALTVRAFLGTHPAFHMPEFPDVHPIANAALYPVLGVACGLASALYCRLDVLAPRIMRRTPGPEWVRPLLGGAIVGAIVVASHGLLAGNGHLAIPREIFGGLAWYLLAALALAKIFATVITLGSGGSGGVFTPALFIGAAVGGSLSSFLTTFLPEQVVHPASWALVGMAGLVSGATRAPLTAIFMVYELTNDSGYVVPLMIVSVISLLTAKRFAPYGLYDGWLAARGLHIAHGIDESVMEHVRVSDALDVEVPRVQPSASIEELSRLMRELRRNSIAVVERDGVFVGLVGHYQLQEALAQPIEARRVMIAEDLVEPLDTLRANQSIREALAAMSAMRRDALAVVATDADGHAEFLGLITRSAAFEAYNHALEHAV